MAAKCVLLLSAFLTLLALTTVQGQQQRQRCTHDAAGDLVGDAVALNKRELIPPGDRIYIHKIMPLVGCQLNGVTARACDMYSPDVEVEVDLSQVTVQRLGPRSQSITLEVTLYCDPAASPKIANV